MKEFTKACITGALLGATLFVVARHADAEIVMYTQNNAGGTIQFSNLRGTCPQGSLGAVVMDSSGAPVAYGCWTYDEPNVVTQWPNQETRYYDPSRITLTKYFAK